MQDNSSYSYLIYLKKIFVDFTDSVYKYITYRNSKDLLFRKYRLLRKSSILWEIMIIRIKIRLSLNVDEESMFKLLNK